MHHAYSKRSLFSRFPCAALALSASRTLMFLAVLLGMALGHAHSELSGSQSTESQYIQGSEITTRVLSAANEYVGKQLKNVGYLVARNTATNTERRFSVVEVFDVVSRNDDIYTVQIDTDEIGGEPRYILFLDLKEIGGKFEVRGMRIGPRHLRQSSAQ